MKQTKNLSASDDATCSASLTPETDSAEFPVMTWPSHEHPLVVRSTLARKLETDRDAALKREKERLLKKGWFPPETAPHDGTPILGDFGFPWANFAVWDEYDEQWCIATLQSSPMADGPMNSWIETDTEKRSALRRWMPLPSLPNDKAELRP